MIRFGLMSITLLVGALYGGLFAALLWWSRTNRLANRLLALLLFVITLRMLPYIIGYAGYYDAYPWLSFMPYNLWLAFGPLLYFYVRSLFASAEALPRGWAWHFLPVALQCIYYGVIFPQPLAFKNDWDSRVHVPFVVPLEQLATFVSVGIYWAKSLRHYRAYQRWLAENVSDREDHHVTWVRNFLIALAITMVIWIGFIAFDRLIAKLNYFQQFPFYVWLAVLTYYLGTEGYRHAAHRYPLWTGVANEPETQVPAPSREIIDWAARGKQVQQKIIAGEWWRDAELTLAGLAKKLGTNTSDLSRAINDGLGLNFNELINRLRVERVRERLAAAEADANILEIAFDAGFSSKASFNRSFKLYTGETPSGYREKHVASRLKS
jgi:AraC-like DNA-binding protein